METRAELLIRKAPKISALDGMFLVDFGTKGVPVIALSPSVMCKAIEKARGEYLTWIAERGTVLCKD